MYLYITVLTTLAPSPFKQLSINLPLLLSGERLDKLAELYLIKAANSAYQCKVCDRTLRDKYAAKDHLECKHFPTDGAYHCTLCGKSYNTRKSLIAHQTHCKPAESF